MSQKDNEKQDCGKNVISSNNDIVVGMVEQACLQGTVTSASAPVTLLSRLAIYLELTNSSIKAMKGQLLWAVLTGRSLAVPSSGTREGVTLVEF